MLIQGPMTPPSGATDGCQCLAALPAVSQQAAVDDLAGIGETVSRALAMMLMLNVPATMGLVVLARPIVELLFEHGRFTTGDTEATAAALRL